MNFLYYNFNKMKYELVILVFLLLIYEYNCYTDYVNYNIEYDMSQTKPTNKSTTTKQPPKQPQPPVQQKQPPTITKSSLTNPKTFVAAQQTLKSNPFLNTMMNNNQIAILGNKVVPVKSVTTSPDGRTQASLIVGNKTMNAVINNGVATLTGTNKPVSLPKVNVTLDNGISNINPATLQKVQDYANSVVAEYGKQFGFSNKPINIELTSGMGKLANGQIVAGHTDMKTNTIKIPAKQLLAAWDREITPGQVNPKGNIAHEIFHAIQENGGASSWLKEASANYMAHKLVGNYNGIYKPVTSVGDFSTMVNSSKGINTLNKKPDNLLTYKEGSAFMGYLDNKYQGSMSALFQQDFRAGSKQPFLNVYGKPAQQLWTEFQTAVETGKFVPSTNTLYD